MSFVVAALTNEEKLVTLEFLHAQDVFLPPSGDFQAFGTISHVTGDLMGVVAFNAFWGHVCTMHAAGVGRNWMSRRLLWTIFDYPFRQLGLRAVIAPVAASNERSLKFVQRCGLKEVHRIPDGWDKGEDLIVLQLLREDCWWLDRLDKRFAH